MSVIYRQISKPEGGGCVGGRKAQPLPRHPLVFVSTDFDKIQPPFPPPPSLHHLPSPPPTPPPPPPSSIVTRLYGCIALPAPPSVFVHP